MDKHLVGGNTKKMSDLDKKMEALIREKLPEMAANELREFIEEAQEAIKERDILAIDLENKQEMADKLMRENQELTSTAKAVISQMKANETKSVELEKKEIKQETEMLKYKNSQLELRVKDSKEFLMLLVKNPRAIEYMSTSSFESIPVDRGNGWVEQHTKSSDKDYTKETLETKEDHVGPINKPNA